MGKTKTAYKKSMKICTSWDLTEHIGLQSVITMVQRLTFYGENIPNPYLELHYFFNLECFEWNSQ